MTMKEIIEQADAISPNAIPEQMKIGWIGELDGNIALNVMLMDISEAQQFRYTYPECMKHEPLVSFPHDGIYVLWLRAKIDDYNGEVERYENSMQQYNAAYGNFVRWFARTYSPAQGYQRSAAYE